MKLWKIENKDDGLVYYYDRYISYLESLQTDSDFMKRALAMIIIMVDTNTILKCRYSLAEIFNAMCENALTHCELVVITES